MLWIRGPEQLQKQSLRDKVCVHVSARTRQPAVTSSLTHSLSPAPAPLLQHAWNMHSSPGCYKTCKHMDETVSDPLVSKMDNECEVPGLW